jgi:hypothetical protein
LQFFGLASFSQNVEEPHARVLAAATVKEAKATKKLNAALHVRAARATAASPK